MGAREEAKSASQTGGEGEPGDKVSEISVWEVSKVPEEQWVSLCMEGTQSMLAECQPSQPTAHLSNPSVEPLNRNSPVS